MKIWDNKNKRWLIVMSIFFDDDKIYKITAHEEGVKDVLKDGWYNIEGEDLKHIVIDTNIKHNTHINTSPEQK